MTAQQPLEPEPGAAQHAMLFHRLDRILRTARIEAAMLPEQRAEKQLVGPQQQPDQTSCSHRQMRFQCASNEARSDGLSALVAARRHNTTTSTSGKRSRTCRKLSRITRLIRLRATARAAQRFEIARPSLERLLEPVRFRSRFGGA